MNIRAAAALLSILLSGGVSAQGYPTKPIRVVTLGAGTANDIVIRMIGQGISGPLGQPIVIDNRAVTAKPEVGIAKGVPDGYTLGYFANPLWMTPLIQDVGYDPLKDFSHISLTVILPNVVTVHAAVPVNSVQELVALAKAKPGSLNVYMSSGAGSASLSALLFQAVTGAKFTNITYKSSSQGMTDLLAGRLHVSFTNIAAAAPPMKAGKIKVLAVTSRERSALAPDIPTMISLGYQDFVSGSIHALVAPPRVPADIVKRLNQEVVAFLRQSEVKAKLAATGTDVVASSPAELASFMKSEMDRLGPVIREAGIKADD